MAKPIQEVCTVREAATTYRLSAATIRRLIASGKIPAIRIGRSIRIDRRGLDDRLAKGGV